MASSFSVRTPFRLKLGMGGGWVVGAAHTLTIIQHYRFVCDGIILLFQSTIQAEARMGGLSGGSSTLTYHHKTLQVCLWSTASSFPVRAPFRLKLGWGGWVVEAAHTLTIIQHYRFICDGIILLLQSTIQLEATRMLSHRHTQCLKINHIISTHLDSTWQAMWVPYDAVVNLGFVTLHVTATWIPFKNPSTVTNPTMELYCILLPLAYVAVPYNVTNRKLTSTAVATAIKSNLGVKLCKMCLRGQGQSVKNGIYTCQNGHNPPLNPYMYTS